MKAEEYKVVRVDNKLAHPFLLDIHYAKRIPSISYTFGLFHFEELVGVVCFGTPPSSTLRAGVAGKENVERILELNRLCLLYNRKNEASFLVSKALKLLPKGKIIISFADSSQNHVGTVYQACNFTYHGLSAKRTDWALRSRPELHGQTVGDLSRGRKDRAKYMRETYGEDFYLKPRARKHRYIFVTGKPHTKKRLYQLIKYKQEAYPKEIL